MKQMLQYLKAYKKESIIAPLFKMLEASFELLVPIVMANIIDVGIQNGDKPYIWRMCALMIALGVLGLVCSLTAQYFAAKAALGYGTALRGALLWMNVCSRSVSSTVRRVNTRADSTPGRAGRSGLAPGERSSLS